MESRATPSTGRFLVSRTWVPVAALLAAALVAYCLFQGVRYWQLSGRSDELGNRIAELSAPDAATMDSRRLRDRLESEEGRSEALLSSFAGVDPTQLMALTSRAAGGAGVNLSSVASDSPYTEVVDGLRYSVLPLNIVVQGEVERVLDFLSRLHDEAPLGSVGRIALANLDSVPTSQLRFLFYHSPRVVDQEEGGS